MITELNCERSTFVCPRLDHWRSQQKVADDGWLSHNYVSIFSGEPPLDRYNYFDLIKIVN